MPEQLPPWLRYTVVLTGLALIVYEALFRDEPRFTLLVVYTAMVGLPSLFGSDVAARRRGADPSPPAPPTAPEERGS